NQYGGIACSAPGHANRYAFSGNTLGGLDNVAHGVSVSAASKIINGTSLAQYLKDLNMGLGDIHNVDIVANTCSIRSGIIIAVQLDDITLPSSSLQHEWNQVRFRLVQFAAALRRPCRIEISQGDIAHAIGRFIPLQGSFDCELGFSIRIG